MEANQLAVYKRSRGFELLTTVNKPRLSSQGVTWTWGLRITSPTLLPLGHAAMKKIAQFVKNLNFNLKVVSMQEYVTSLWLLWKGYI